MMEEQQAVEVQQPQQQPAPGRGTSLPPSVLVGGGTALGAGIIDVVGHLGPTGLVVGGIAAFVAARHSGDLIEGVRTAMAPFIPPAKQLPDDQDSKPARSGRSFLDRALGRFPDETPASEPKEATLEEQAAQEADELDRKWEDLALGDEPDDLPPPPSAMRKNGMFVFSQVLDGFKPSLNKVYLGQTLDGESVYCAAKDLCHVALGGSTGGGKSSIMRMLMAQLCRAGASVLLLNPHYTRYDIENDEDWTPFEPYLVYDPMETRHYESIQHYLHYVAEVLLPKRLDKRARSEPWGRPYFIVLDELPAIVEHIGRAPGWLKEILREGRKVGIFVISASQDFLVKTIGGDGGGAVRDCYRTAYYVGGDPTTAKVLLDMPAREIVETELGRGQVMIRCAGTLETKKAARARVPYVDNESLYKLLGPSTYKPASSEPDTDELPVLGPIPGRSPEPQRREYELANSVQDSRSRTAPTVPETRQDALVEPVPTGPGTVRDGPGTRSQVRDAGFVPGPNDRQFSQAQERQFQRLVERDPGQGTKEYLRLMKLGNAYAKHAGYILRTKTGKDK